MTLKAAVAVCVLALLALLVPSAAKADSLITNPDFAPGPTESGSCGGGCTYNTGPIPDWTATSGTEYGTFDPTSAQFASMPSGASTAGFINGNNTPGQPGTLTQDVTALEGVALSPDTVYTLSVYVGDRGDYNDFTTYDFGLEAGSTLLASSGWLSNGPSSIAQGTFGLETVTFSTNSTVDPGDLTVFLSANGLQGDFTDVSLTATPTPEPSSLILLLIGLAGMGLAWKRYGSKSAQPVTVA